MYLPNQLRELLTPVAAPSLVGVGDNVLDCYLDEDLAYPGGNALNVAVYSRLFFGGESGFIGIMGDDRFAEHLRHTLLEVGVDCERTRRAHGANGMAFVSLDSDGDRRFVGSNYGGVQHQLRLRMTEQDHDYLARFARLHTSVYSSIESELPSIVDRGTKTSFDYSNDATDKLIAETAPYVEVGFFSAGQASASEVDDLGQRGIRAGMQTVVVTRGDQGAVAYEKGARHPAAVKDVTAVDALGAGDAFIAGFLAGRAGGLDTDACMDVAATTGALACTMRGAFGYPVVAGVDARKQILRRYSHT